MDPMPGTDTAAIGARRHLCGNREGGVEVPNTPVVNAENGQIFRLEAVHIRSVCNGESATLQVIDSLGGNKSAALNHPSEAEETHVG